MPDEVFQRLLDWGEEIGGDGEVIVVDFRDSDCVQAALIGVEEDFSVAPLVAHLLAMAFDVRQSSDIDSVVEASGVPYTFVRPKFFERSPSENDAESNQQAVTMLSRVTRLPVVYVDVTKNIARQSMRQLGVPASLIEGLLQSPQAASLLDLHRWTHACWASAQDDQVPLRQWPFAANNLSDRSDCVDDRAASGIRHEAGERLQRSGSTRFA